MNMDLDAATKEAPTLTLDPFAEAKAEIVEKKPEELDALLNMDDRENDDPDRERTTEKPSVLAELRDRAGRIPPVTHRDDEEVAL